TASVMRLPAVWNDWASTPRLPSSRYILADQKSASTVYRPRSGDVIVLMGIKPVAQLALLGIQIVFIMGVATNVQRHPFDDLDTVGFQRLHLSRVVGHQLQTSDTQMFKHVLAHAVIP